MAPVSDLKGSRQVFLDVLRVFATMAVVMMHTISGVLNGNYDFTGYERRVKAFRALVDATSVSVPLFLMISGYLFLNPDKKISWKDAILKYCRRILLALLFFGVPFAFLEIFRYVGKFEWWMIPHSFWYTATGRSWAHLWYLYLILILYAGTPLLKWFLEKAPALICVVMAALALGVSLLPFCEVLMGASRIIGIPTQGIYLFYYLCGYLFAVRKKAPGRAEGVLCLVGSVVILALEMGSRFIEGYDVDMAYGYPLTLIATVLLFDAAWTFEWLKRREEASHAKGEGKGESGNEAKSADEGKGWNDVKTAKRGLALKLTLWLSPLCFGIYLIHPVFLNFFYKYKNVSIMNYRFYVGVPLFFGIAFVGSVIGTWVLRLIPPLRRYVL